MAEFARLQQPAGGLPNRRSMQDVRLFLCTDARRRQGDLADFLDAVLAAGVDAVQLRDKSLEALDEIDIAAVFQAACRRHGRLFSVNDRADIAAALRPDILHLGQRDLPVPVARSIVGDAVLIGRSTHAADEVAAAVDEAGVDYFCVGPVWPTPTKPGRSAPGPPLLRYAAAVAPPGESGSRPWFAIGGIDLGNLGEVLEAGARRVVVVRAITDAVDPAAAAAEFAGRLAEAVSS